MKRRLNSTGRQKIAAEHVAIRLLEETGRSRRFTANLAGLETLGLDGDARVVIEAFAKTSSMRFDFGTVNSIRPPEDTVLSEIDRGAGVLFRVKVIDVKNVPGRLLAASGSLRPHDESDHETDRKALLPIRETDLGQAVWQLEFADKPWLLVNRALPSIAQRLQSDPVLQGAIFPAVLESVLEEILDGSATEEDEWVAEWRAFAGGLLREPLPTDVPESEVGDWVRRVVDAFNLSQKWVTKARTLTDASELPYE